jgi:hypothetical protein
MLHHGYWLFEFIPITSVINKGSGALCEFVPAE